MSEIRAALEQFWVRLALCAGVVLGLAAGIATHLARPTTSAWASGLTLFVVTATLMAVVWYALETRRLLDHQRESAAVDKHPWLAATDLSAKLIAPREGEFPLGGHDLWLPIKNVGRTPALAVEVHVGVEVKVDEARTQAFQRQRGQQVLVPGDTLHQEISRQLSSEGPDESIAIDVTIGYKTLDGGKGRIAVQFLYNPRDGWRNGPTTYRVWLSDGAELGPP